MRSTDPTSFSSVFALTVAVATFIAEIALAVAPIETTKPEHPWEAHALRVSESRGRVLRVKYGLTVLVAGAVLAAPAAWAGRASGGALLAVAAVCLMAAVIAWLAVIVRGYQGADVWEPGTAMACSDWFDRMRLQPTAPAAPVDFLRRVEPCATVLGVLYRAHMREAGGTHSGIRSARALPAAVTHNRHRGRFAASTYESWDFSATPTPADAFQDAGGNSAEALEHRRGSEQPVRGC